MKMTFNPGDAYLMIRHLKLLFCSLILFAAIGETVLAQSESSAHSYYLIGKSLTWDTVPQRLDGDVQWHVDCGVSLPYIYSNPNKPCVKESTVWPTALRDKQYDAVSVQPHYGATLARDVETISAWMKLQPNAVFVIHSGWAFHAQRADEFADYTSPDESMPLVAALPKLEAFRIGSAQVTDEGLRHLFGAKSLKKITVSGLKQVTDAGIEELKKARPELIVEVR